MHCLKPNKEVSNGIAYFFLLLLDFSTGTGTWTWIGLQVSQFF